MAAQGKPNDGDPFAPLFKAALKWVSAPDARVAGFSPRDVRAALSQTPAPKRKGTLVKGVGKQRAAASSLTLTVPQQQGSADAPQVRVTVGATTVGSTAQVTPVQVSMDAFMLLCALGGGLPGWMAEPVVARRAGLDLQERRQIVQEIAALTGQIPTRPVRW